MAHHKNPSLTSLWRWKFRQKGLLSSNHSMMSLIVTFLLVTQLLSKICSFMPQSQCNPPGRQYPLELSTFLQISLREKNMLSPQNGQWLYAFVSRTRDWLSKERRVSDVSSSPRSSSQCGYWPIVPPLKIGRQESLPLLKDGIPLSYCNLFCTWYVSCDQNMLLRHQYYICNLKVVIEVVLHRTVVW